MARPTLTKRVSRSLTLLRAFVVASALLLALAAVVLGTILTHALRGQAVDDSKVSLMQYTNSVVSDRLVRGDRLIVGRAVYGLVKHDIAGRPDILSVKVWRPDGVLAWTNLEPRTVGRQRLSGRDCLRGDSA